MAKPTDLETHDDEDLTTPQLSVRERRAQTVRAISEAGRDLYSVRADLEEVIAAGRIPSDELKLRLAACELRYKRLEDQLKGFMRPQVKDEWLYGGHRHGPDDSHDHGDLD